MMKKRLCLSSIFGLVLVFIGLVGIANAAQGIRLNAALFDKVHTLSQEQLEFTAENFDSVLVGQWSLDIEKASDLKFYNPEISIIGYINSKHLIPGSWRYQECEQNGNLFAYAVNGNKIKSLDFGQVLTDIHNPDWTGKIIEWANKLPSHFDGIFLDVAQPTLVEPNYKHLPGGYDPYQHAIAMTELFYNIRQEYYGTVTFNGLKEGLKYVGYATDVDAGVLEGFVFSRSRQNVDPGTIQNHVNALIEAGKRGLTGSACTKGYKENIDNRIFALACYLLGANELSTYGFVDMNNEFSNPLQYYPEYGIDLGNPVDYPDEVEDLRDPGTNLFIRLFEEGMVIINPWSEDIEIQLDGEYSEVIPYGGGVVGTDGTYDGYLDYENVSGSVTVPGKSAMILTGVAAQPVISEIVVDDGDPGTSYTGTWKISDAAQPWDNDSLYAWNGATYTWTADIKGNLKVSMWWTTRKNSNKKARIDVYDGEKYVGTIYVNQKNNGGKWNTLGTHTFSSAPKIVIHGSRWVTTCADAVKFVVVN